MRRSVPSCWKSRRPRSTGLDRNDLGALLDAAGLGPPAGHALISLLALNGLRVCEAAGATIEALGAGRVHRTLVITRKGGKVVTIPLAPRTAGAIDLAVGERSEGPVFLPPMAADWIATAPRGSSAGQPAMLVSASRLGRTHCGTNRKPRVWKHSQITWTCYLGGICLASRGCQRAGSLPPLP
jgi:integrase